MDADVQHRYRVVSVASLNGRGLLRAFNCMWMLVIGVLFMVKGMWPRSSLLEVLSTSVLLYWYLHQGGVASGAWYIVSVAF